MLVRLAWTGPPTQACKLPLAWTPAQPRFAPLQEKNISYGGSEDPGRNENLWVSILIMFNC